MNGRDPTIKKLWEFFCLIEEALGIPRVEKHRAECGVPKKREHGGEVNAAPAPALDDNVFGRGAVACVKDVDFHKRIIVIASERS